MLERSVSAFLEHSSIDEVVVALPTEIADAPPVYLSHSVKPLHLTVGGNRRRDSVAAAFNLVAPQADIVLVHDAARPLVSAALVARTIRAAVDSGVAVAALAAIDTVKRVRQPASRLVSETISRDLIFLAQTPQGFRRAILNDVLAQGLDRDATDEATLAEEAGYAVQLVEGEPANIKITTPDDLVMAEAIVRNRTGQRGRLPRVGIGYDLHRLVAGRRLILGGVEIAFDRGLLGHSDADVLCHAVTDAVLGAAGAGDIGSHFPDTDPQWAGAPGLGLLGRATLLVGAQGYAVESIDAVVIAEQPKLRPHVDAMRRNLAEALGVAPDRISIKGKTNEGVDAIGRGEAIAAHAVALVRSRS